MEVYPLERVHESEGRKYIFIEYHECVHVFINFCQCIFPVKDKTSDPRAGINDHFEQLRKVIGIWYSSKVWSCVCFVVGLTYQPLQFIFLGSKFRSQSPVFSDLNNRPHFPASISYINSNCLWLNIVLWNSETQLPINPQYRCVAYLVLSRIKFDFIFSVNVADHFLHLASHFNFLFFFSNFLVSDISSPVC